MTLLEAVNEAKFISFILKRLDKEEILEGERMYEAFLPASNSINQHFNDVTFNAKTWGEYGLKAAQAFANKLKSSEKPSLASLHFDLSRARRDYEYLKKNEKTVFGEYRGYEESYSVSTTYIELIGKYQDQYLLLHQVLALNLSNGTVDSGEFHIDKELKRCKTISFDILGTLKQKPNDRHFKRNYTDSYPFLFTTIKHVIPGNGNAEFFISNIHLSKSSNRFMCLM